MSDRGQDRVRHGIVMTPDEEEMEREARVLGEPVEAPPPREGVIEPPPGPAAGQAPQPVPSDDSLEDEQGARLLSEEDAAELRARWQAIQTGFVDRPREAVAEADELVGRVIEQVADLFASERETLEEQWDRGDDVSTESLRLSFRRYRFFFDRLLTV